MHVAALPPRAPTDARWREEWKPVTEDATGAFRVVRADDRPFLRIYMNDQLAAGMLWREVARRAQHNNAGTEGGERWNG
jgi:hypothetical protein